MALQFKIHDVANICKGQIIQSGPSSIQVQSIGFDSRKLFNASNCVFFALVTERNNGHKYLLKAYEKGVRVFVVSETVELPEDANVINVSNTLLAAQMLMGFHRQKFNFPVVAITGSNGKTIVKEWLYQIMHSDFKIVRSPKSYNSQIGVPLSLSLLSSWNDMAIIEAGISQRNEMDKLAAMIQPTHGLITNLKEAHSSGFTSDEEKLNQKLNLFESCKTIFYQKDERLIATQIENRFRDKELVSWSHGESGFLSRIETNVLNNKTEIVAQFQNTSISIVIPFIDSASIENAIHAWAVALYFGLAPELIATRMLQLQPVEMRLNIARGLKESTVISDYYNSDPSSVRIALQTLHQQNSTGNKIAVLSAFEQIEQSDRLYDSVFEMIASQHLDQLVLIGREWERFADQENVSWFSTTNQFLLEISQLQLRNAVVLLKGARRFSFEKVADYILEKKHETFLEVNLEALVHNLNYYKSILPHSTKIMAMVKAFSYGSGSVEVASLLQYHDVDYLGVAYLEEGVSLRAAGISLPIMVMNPSVDGFGKLLKYRLEPEIYSLSLLRAFLKETAQNQNPEAHFRIHLKIDTGMHRLGFEAADLDELIDLLLEDRRVEIATVFTHLAGADSSELDDFSKSQIEIFEEVCGILKSKIKGSFMQHILNSAGVVRFPEYSKDMVRLGIGLYGLDSSKQNQSKLTSVTRFVTHISQIKHIKKGESVGYSRAFVAKRNSTIATLPVGYADGYFRSLGQSKSQVYIKGAFCPVIGNVCMDMLMVDITGHSFEEGDEVELFGQHILVEDLAKSADTISYEMLVHISSRVPRVYLQN